MTDTVADTNDTLLYLGLAALGMGAVGYGLYRVGKAAEPYVAPSLFEAAGAQHLLPHYRAFRDPNASPAERGRALAAGIAAHRGARRAAVPVAANKLPLLDPWRLARDAAGNEVVQALVWNDPGYANGAPVTLYPKRWQGEFVTTTRGNYLLGKRAADDSAPHGAVRLRQLAEQRFAQAGEEEAATRVRPALPAAGGTRRMNAVSVWGKYKGKVEKIDEATTRREAEHLAGEYALAFGRDWTVWAGKRVDDPSSRVPTK